MPALADATLNAAGRRMLDRFVEALSDRLGDGLVSVWLFGSRARGEDTGRPARRRAAPRRHRGGGVPVKAATRWPRRT